jgi:uncharacterized protein YceH (UPF0502 family)
MRRRRQAGEKESRVQALLAAAERLAKAAEPPPPGPPKIGSGQSAAIPADLEERLARFENYLNALAARINALEPTFGYIEDLVKRDYGRRRLQRERKQRERDRNKV